MPDARCFGLVEPIEGKGRGGREGREREPRKRVGEGRDRGRGGGGIENGVLLGENVFFLIGRIVIQFLGFTLRTVL